jgi:Uma2 family endonuclease
MATLNPASSRTITEVTPADWLTQKPQGSWTYEDYVALPEDGNRYEIIDEVIYMTASPNKSHQKSANILNVHLMIHVYYAQKGEVFIAPFDVTLPSGTTVQPDIMVVLNANSAIAQENGIVGAPDLLVEVASPSTKTYDRTTKKQTYEQNGVREYWIVDPVKQEVEIFELQNGAYVSLGTFKGKNLVPSQIVPGFPIRVEQFFA